MMRKVLFKILPVCLNLFLSNATYPAFDPMAAGAKSAGMAYASVTMTDAWSVFNNQAGMAGLTCMTGGLYFENKYLLKELGVKCGAFILPTKAGVLGCSLQQTGFSLYSENIIGLAYARNFGHYLSAGIKLDYFNLSISEGYGQRNGITFEAGIQTRLTEKFSAGIFICHPLSSKLAAYPAESISPSLQIGAIYHLTGNILFILQVNKTASQKPDYKAGTEFEVLPSVYLRAGISTNPAIFAAGAGYDRGKLTFDLAVSCHQYLGCSPSLSIQYRITATKLTK